MEVDRNKVLELQGKGDGTGVDEFDNDFHRFFLQHRHSTVVGRMRAACDHKFRVGEEMWIGNLRGHQRLYCDDCVTVMSSDPDDEDIRRRVRAALEGEKRHCRKLPVLEGKAGELKSSREHEVFEAGFRAGKESTIDSIEQVLAKEGRE